MMKGNWSGRLKSMSIDELYSLHKKIRSLLEVRLNARKAEVERKLATLDQPAERKKKAKRRRGRS
jgi:hypothetical protein